MDADPLGMVLVSGTILVVKNPPSLSADWHTARRRARQHRRTPLFAHSMPFGSWVIVTASMMMPEAAPVQEQNLVSDTLSPGG
jgi:hypothetical protein